jgi:hypothetical protein
MLPCGHAITSHGQPCSHAHTIPDREARHHTAMPLSPPARASCRVGPSAHSKDRGRPRDALLCFLARGMGRCFNLVPGVGRFVLPACHPGLTTQSGAFTCLCAPQAAVLPRPLRRPGAHLRRCARHLVQSAPVRLGPSQPARRTCTTPTTPAAQRRPRPHARQGEPLHVPKRMRPAVTEGGDTLSSV